MEFLGSPCYWRRSSNKKNELFLPGGGQKNVAPSRFFWLFCCGCSVAVAVCRNCHPYHHHHHHHTPPPPHTILCPPSLPPPPPPPTETEAETTRSTFNVPRAHFLTCKTHRYHLTFSRAKLSLTCVRTYLLSFRVPNACLKPSKNHPFLNIFEKDQKKVFSMGTDNQPIKHYD